MLRKKSRGTSSLRTATSINLHWPASECAMASVSSERLPSESNYLEFLQFQRTRRHFRRMSCLQFLKSNCTPDSDDQKADFALYSQRKGLCVLASDWTAVPVFDRRSELSGYWPTGQSFSSTTMIWQRTERHNSGFVSLSRSCFAGVRQDPVS